MKKIFIILVSISLCACTLFNKVKRDIKRNYPCYTVHATDSDTILNFNGCYRVATLTTKYQFIERYGFLNLFIRNKLVEDTVFHNILFYPNGMCVYNFRISGKETNYKTEYKYGNWGHYNVTNDTVKIYYLQGPSDIILNTDVAWEQSFKIINRNTISYISNKAIHTVSKQNMKLHNYAYLDSIRASEYFPASFVPLEQIPDSDLCWLKKEKWFWCNKEDWEKHMEKIKKK